MKNLMLLACSMIFVGCGSVRKDYVSKVKHEFENRMTVKSEILRESEILNLPAPVRKYITLSGALGKPKPANMRLEFEARMWRTPGGKPLPATSVQYNFMDDPTRIFFMKASQFLVPFRVLHAYIGQESTMLVRVAGLFNAVDLKGEELSHAETVTILNDLCVFAPGALTDPRLAWEAIDSLSTKVFFANGSYRVSAILHFNERGELVNFVSDDRAALQDDGTLKRVRWSTPLKDYKEFDGRLVASHGSAIYHYPEGDFTYGFFVVKSIAYNVTEYKEE